MAKAAATPDLPRYSWREEKVPVCPRFGGVVAVALCYNDGMENLFLFDNDQFITTLNDEQSPGHLDQIELFYDDTEKLFDSISDIIAASQLAVTYATTRSGEFKALPAVEPSGWLLQWPTGLNGLSCVVKSDESGAQNALQAVFPFCSDGVTYSCRLTGVRLFSNRLEAQLQVMAGEEEELALTFYDARYLCDRVVYQKDAVYLFNLRAFAYFFAVMPPGQDSVDGLWALLNRPDLGADHYEIHGPVRSVAELELPMLGQKVWRVSVVIGCSSEMEEQLLDILVTGKVLGNTPSPVEGSQIRAVVWLQGHLWGEEKA